MQQHSRLTWLVAIFLVACLGLCMVRAGIFVDRVGITDAKTGITKSEILRVGGKVFSTSRATLSWIWRTGRHAFINYFAPCMYWAGKKVVGIAVSTGTALVVRSKDVLAAQRAGLVGIPVKECGDGVFCALGDGSPGQLAFFARSGTFPLLKELILQVVIYQSNETPPELYYIQQLEERGQIEAYRTDEYFSRIHPFMAVTTSAGKKALMPFQLAGRWLALLTPPALEIMRDTGSRLGLASLRQIRRQFWRSSADPKVPLPDSLMGNTALSRPKRPQNRIPPKDGRAKSPTSKSVTRTRHRSDERKKSKPRIKTSSTIKTLSDAATVPQATSLSGGQAHAKQSRSKMSHPHPATKAVVTPVNPDRAQQAKLASQAASDKKVKEAKSANSRKRARPDKSRSRQSHRAGTTSRPSRSKTEAYADRAYINQTSSDNHHSSESREHTNEHIGRVIH